jgi:hypothetical protein
MDEPTNPTGLCRYVSLYGALSKRRAAHRQLVKFSLDRFAGCAARSIPIHSVANNPLCGSKLSYELHQHAAVPWVHPQPAAGGAILRLPPRTGQHCRSCRARRLSYINISNTMRGMARPASSMPAVAPPLAQDRMHCFVSCPADLSRDGASLREGGRRPACTSCSLMFTNITSPTLQTCTNITDRGRSI